MTALRRLLCLLALVAVALVAAAAPAAAQQHEPEDDFTAVWTRAQALKIRQDPTNTKPRIPPDFPVMNDEVWVWDTWPMTRPGHQAGLLQGLACHLLADGPA